MIDFHPLANIFPLMEEEEYDQLVADIVAHGQLEPIVLHTDGRVLDGRNRYRACVKAGVEPKCQTHNGDDPLSLVISLNLRRRHLDASQRAMVAAKIANLKHGGDRVSEQGANLRLGPDQPSISVKTAADMLNVSERIVDDARLVVNVGIPELRAKVEAGRVSVSAAGKVARLPATEQQAVVELTDDEIVAKAKRIHAERAEALRVKNAALKASTPRPIVEGRYDVIVVDPPWNMEKIERNVRPNQVAFDYPTMTNDELRTFPVANMAAEDCHLFCWTTQRFLPHALGLLKDWGFSYVLTMVWYKTGGIQPVGLPQYNCEFALYARRGSPKFVDTKAFPCCFTGKRREHSRKPAEFYEIIVRVTDGQRIDVFSREHHDGFSQIGNEVSKFRSAA